MQTIGYSTLGKVLCLVLLALPQIAKAMDDTAVILETAILERINLARANPWDEAAKLSIDPAILRQAAPPELAEAWDQDYISPLTINATLNAVAADHCREMLERNSFSAISPEGVTPTDRINAAGYQAEAVEEEIGAVAFEYFIEPGPAMEIMINTLLVKAFWQAAAGNPAVLLHPDFFEAGIALRSGTVQLYGFTYDVYVLSVIVARPIDAIDRQIQCGYIYDDANGNDRFEYGEGRAYEKLTVRPLKGDAYSLRAKSDGFYCFRQPIDYFFVRICEKLDFQFENSLDERPDTTEIIDRDYNGFNFSCN
jgi:hypothetical protein